MKRRGLTVPRWRPADPEALARFDGRLPTFFPPDDARSQWLFRLSVLRDDLTFEVANLGLAKRDDHREVWRCSYFLRRISITLLEAIDIIEHDLTNALKEANSPYSGEFGKGLKAAAATVRRHRHVLELVRHRIGGHVRPTNRPKGIAPGPSFQDTVSKHRGWGGRVFIDMNNGRATSLQRISSAVFLFAWPDVADDVDLAKRHDEYYTAVMGTFHAVVPSIDTLLYMFWREKNVRRARARSRGAKGRTAG